MSERDYPDCPYCHNDDRNNEFGIDYEPNERVLISCHNCQKEYYVTVYVSWCYSESEKAEVHDEQEDD